MTIAPAVRTYAPIVLAYALVLAAWELAGTVFHVPKPSIGEKGRRALRGESRP